MGTFRPREAGKEHKMDNVARTLSKEEIRDLSPAQRLELMDELWESLTPEEIPVPEWHRRLLDEAVKDYTRDPDEGEPWDEVRDQIFRRK
jgi:putative addiction module component (TIGR02574 family)